MGEQREVLNSLQYVVSMRGEVTQLDGTDRLRAKRQGKQLGRPVADVDMNKVRKVQSAGLSLRATAAKVGWSPSLLRKRLAS
jgi:hypothetical protein